jgi:hypothetical protein
VPLVASELSVEHGSPVNGFVAVDGVGSRPLGSAGDTVTSGPVGNVSGALGFGLCAGDVAELSAAKPAIRQSSLDHLPIIGLPDHSSVRTARCCAVDRQSSKEQSTAGIWSRIVSQTLMVGCRFRFFARPRVLLD